MSDHLHEAKLRGDEARRLMEDDGILAFALREAKKMYINEWAQSQPFETNRREMSYLKLQALGDIEAQITKIIGEGTAAVRQIAALQQRQKR